MEGLIFGILRYLLAQLDIWLLGLTNNSLLVIRLYQLLFIHWYERTFF